MTTRNITLAASALFLALAANAKSGQYTIEGEFTGLADGSKVTLREVAHEPMPDLLIAVSKDGKFIFQGEIDQPRAVALFVDGKFPSQDTRFIIEPGNISITADVTPREEGELLKIENLRFAGSPLTAKYRDLLSVRDDLDKLYPANQEKHKEVAQRYYEARSARNTELMKEIEESDAFKAFKADDKAFFEQVQASFTEVIMQNKEDFFGPLMMISLMNFFDESNRPLFSQMSEEAQKSIYGERVYAELYPIGKTGAAMPAISLKDRNGNTVTLEEVCAGKKYVLLDFWASWCRPCRAEIPNFKKIYEKYADQGFDIYSVSIDDDPESWKRALDMTGMTWTNVIDIDDKAAIDYKVRAVPTIYILDGNGNLIAENLRGEELETKIAELLK